MKKIFLFLLIIFLFNGCTQNNEYYQEKENNQIEKISVLNIGSRVINIEIADTFESRKKGLSGRDGLCQDCGLLFIFPEKDIHSFWMKDMKFPIDIIWINNNTVVDIVENADIPQNGRTPTFRPSKKADQVLEVNAGFCEKNGIIPGVEVKLLTENDK